MTSYASFGDPSRRRWAVQSTDRGGTILDPDDGKVYKAELWVEEGKLKVRGYLRFFYRTQT
jgi:uncharacterized protein (DUF2147 family)